LSYRHMGNGSCGFSVFRGRKKGAARMGIRAGKEGPRCNETQSSIPFPACPQTSSVGGHGYGCGTLPPVRPGMSARFRGDPGACRRVGTLVREDGSGPQACSLPPPGGSDARGPGEAAEAGTRERGTGRQTGPEELAASEIRHVTPPPEGADRDPAAGHARRHLSQRQQVRRLSWPSRPARQPWYRSGAATPDVGHRAWA